MIDNEVLKKAAKQYLERKVKWLNRKGAEDLGTLKFDQPSKDGRIYSMWINEDTAFRDGALWAIRMMEKENMLNDNKPYSPARKHPYKRIK